MSILFVSSEAYPLVKTGGLADVAGALPPALLKHGADVRLLMPAYPEALDKVLNRREGRHFGDPFGIGEVSLIDAQMPDSGMPVSFVSCNTLFNRRGGGPYQQASGEEWPDNHARFALLSYVAAQMGIPEEEGAWAPDILHVNDWQCGLVPAYLHYCDAKGLKSVKSVYTIHNLRYQGLFDPAIMPIIRLPANAMQVEGVEFHGALSYMKAGINFADAITTVSRTYAKEIQTEEFGYGLEGLLRLRANDLHGIVNGIDYDIWNPTTDRHIAQHYSIENIEAKQRNKMALQQEMGLPRDPDAPLFSFVGRLTEQKGVDLITDNLQQIVDLGGQLVLLGTGEPQYEELLRQAADHNDRISARIAYSEELAHRLIAGSDAFLMPSRFEPCGLTQMYALRYGTLPIVRKTGGLADTVTDINATAGPDGDGFAFNEATSGALLEAIRRAAEVYREPSQWRRFQANAMRKDFSWEHSAQDYLRLYEELGVSITS